MNMRSGVLALVFLSCSVSVFAEDIRIKTDMGGANNVAYVGFPQGYDQKTIVGLPIRALQDAPADAKKQKNARTLRDAGMWMTVGSIIGSVVSISLGIAALSTTTTTATGLATGGTNPFSTSGALWLSALGIGVLSGTVFVPGLVMWIIGETRL